MGLKILDKYIIIQFVKNFLFSTLCFILIFILVDLFENLDKFIDNKLSLFMVASYYFYFIPEIVRLISPISVLLSTLFTAGRMINYNEIIAVKNAGVSLMRFMVPFLLVGVIITGIAVYFNNWVVPEANKKKFFFDRNYLGKNRDVTGFNRLYFQDSPNQLVIIEEFREIESTAYKVSILKYNPDTLTSLLMRADAETMKWDGGKWVLYKAVTRDFKTQTEQLTTYDSIGAPDLVSINQINVQPEQITKKQWKPDEMNYTELKAFVSSQLKGGQNTDRTQVDFYSKMSFPFSNLIIIIFGISISTGSKRRKGLALQFGISILVSFIYLGFEKISQSFGYNGDLNPVITAWLANTLFAAFGTVNLIFRNY
jgi:lipopolysaccharide export system permease protein